MLWIVVPKKSTTLVIFQDLNVWYNIKCEVYDQETWEEREDWGKYPIRTFYYSRVGERSAAMVEEEVKKGIKAYNLNGGLIEWLMYDG